jgi:hypothetical protein
LLRAAALLLAGDGEAVAAQQRDARAQPAVDVVHLHRHLPDLAPVVRPQPVQHAQLVAWGCRQRRRAAAVRSIFTQALPLSPLGPP